LVSSSSPSNWFYSWIHK